MIRFRRFALVAAATLLVASACASIPALAPTPTPGSQAPTGTAPPAERPSFPIGGLPSVDASGGACQLITADEVAGIMGTTARVSDSSSNSCSYLLGTFASIVVTVDQSDLSGVRILLGNSAQDLTINNLPAVSGVFIGQPAVYVQRGGDQLQVLGVLTGNNDATKAKILQIAQTAVSRW